MSDTDRARDARAAEVILGWEDVAPVSYMNSDGTSTVYWRGTVPSRRNKYGIAPRCDLPAFGTDPAAARALLAAVPEEKRSAVGARLLHVLGYTPIEASMVLLTFEDVWRLLTQATPAAIRDAVLEAMEG